MKTRLGVILAIIFVLSLFPAGVSQSGPSSDNPSYVEATVNPECVLDLDCGVEYENYSCWKRFVVKDNVRFVCANAGLRNATCETVLDREVLEWCRDDEYCMPGERVCQPNISTSCSNGLRDGGETGIDCGGPCKPCNSCNDGIRNGDEDGVDCGGSCPACVIQCTTNVSCGIPHWTTPYCGEDGSVYQDYVSYECVRPGTYSSACKQHRLFRLSDYCGPTNRCRDGRCYDDEDREPYAYKDGGYYGTHWPRLVDQYRCEEGEGCLSDGRVFVTCRGDWCFEIKEPVTG